MRNMQDVRHWLMELYYVLAVFSVDARCVLVLGSKPLVLAPLIGTFAVTIVNCRRDAAIHVVLFSWWPVRKEEDHPDT